MVHPAIENVAGVCQKAMYEFRHGEFAQMIAISAADSRITPPAVSTRRKSASGLPSRLATTCLLARKIWPSCHTERGGFGLLTRGVGSATPFNFRNTR